MAGVTIQAGAKIDIPSRAEIRDDIRDVWIERQRASMRTLKYMSIAEPVVPAAVSVFIPLPNPGYMWNLKLISAQMSASATLQAFIASSAPAAGATLPRLISNFGAAATSQVVTFSSSQVQLRPDEGIFLLASTGTITALFIAAEEAMAERQGIAYD